MNNLAQAPAGIKFGQIARAEIDFAEADLQKILSGRLNRATDTCNNQFLSLILL